MCILKTNVLYEKYCSKKHWWAIFCKHWQKKIQRPSTENVALNMKECYNRPQERKRIYPEDTFCALWTKHKKEDISDMQQGGGVWCSVTLYFTPEDTFLHYKNISFKCISSYKYCVSASLQMVGEHYHHLWSVYLSWPLYLWSVNLLPGYGILILINLVLLIRL